MRNALAIFAVCLALIIGGCDDNTTNNYYTTNTGSIYGTVSPVDLGIARAVGINTYETNIGADGFFHISGLPPGVYDLILLPQNHTKRVIRSIVVAADAAIEQRGLVISNLPYPIFATDPEDGEVEVSTSILRIRCDEQLDLASLNGGTTIEPAAAGEWHTASVYGAPFTYRFDAANGDELFLPGQKYRLTLSTDVKTELGAALALPLEMDFTTKSITFEAEVPLGDVTGFVPILDFNFGLRFDRCVNKDSVERLITFEPPIHGVWLTNSAYDGYYCGPGKNHRDYEFFALQLPLQAKTQYLAIVSSGVSLIEGAGLSKTDTIYFQTEPYGVIEVNPMMGHPFFALENDIHVVFNATMDTASVEDAFSVQEIGGAVIQGNFVWTFDNRRMTYQHAEYPMASMKAHRIFVAKSAHTLAGVYLEEDFESYFTTR